MERKKKGPRKKSKTAQKVVPIKSHLKVTSDRDAIKKHRAQTLIAEYQQTLKEIEMLREREAKIVATVPRVEKDENGEYVPGAIEQVDYIHEIDDTVTYWWVPDEVWTDAEKLAMSALANLRHQLGKKRQHLNFIRTQAAVEGIELPEQSAKSGGKKAKRPGPKGPRQQTIKRRAIMKSLKGRGITGREACRKLNEIGIPLQSGRLREIYNDDWVEFFDFETNAFYKQWSADLKRG